MIDTSDEQRDKLKKQIFQIMSGEQQLRSKRELIEKFIRQNIPEIEKPEDVEKIFDSFWTKEKEVAVDKLVSEEGLDKSMFINLVENYVWQNMYITVDILKKLRKVYPTQKLILIWDNCGWHRGSKVTEWITADNNTETIYFPPYTPDLNPQEHVWKAGRKNVTHNQYIQKIEETAEKFKDYITKQKFNYELLGFKAQV